MIQIGSEEKSDLRAGSSSQLCQKACGEAEKPKEK
jgi:hypothetical protein